MFRQQNLEKIPIVGILRHVSTDDVMQILPIYREAGLTTIEITMNSTDAERTIERAVKRFGAELNIGAGTVRSTADLKRARQTGAQFIVTPNIDEEVITTCRNGGIPIFPGALTPSEIARAWNLGATMVKLFPARAVGKRYIKDILEPLDDIKLMATGGIDLPDLAGYLNVGVSAIGMGSSLFPKAYIEKKDWPTLKVHFMKVIAEIENYRTKSKIK